MGDLRTERTTAAIKDAFLTLRAKKPIERITVRELADLAQINKATFYLHYRDIYDLSERMESEILSSILDTLVYSELRLADPMQFVRDLISACEPHVTAIRVLFSGSRAAILPDKIEENVKAIFYRDNPQSVGDLYADVLLTYVIQGSYRAYIKHEGRSRLKVLAMVADITGNVSNLYQNKYAAAQKRSAPEAEDAQN